MASDASPASSLPHARGGVSGRETTGRDVGGVFPTHVGVFPTPAKAGTAVLGLPHARGGVSKE